MCTPLRWKQEWLKRPIFRGFDGSAVSDGKPLPYHKLNDDMERQTLDAGFEKALGPKAFRRGAANAADGNASDAVRDQMMRHDPRWATFNGAYINEKVEFHLERVVAGEPTDDCLIDLFTHMSLTRDPEARQNMVPDEVWQSLEPDPEISELEAQRDKFKNGRYRIRGTKHEDKVRELTKTIRMKKAQREKSIREYYRQYYFYHRPTWEIERQLANDDHQVEEVYSAPVIDLHIPERARLAKLLCQQADDLDFDGFLRLRIEVAELMTSLIGKRETVKRRRIVNKVHSSVACSSQGESSEPDRFPLLMGKAQCPRCIGDESMTVEERTFSYCRPAVMNDHFGREHLVTMEQMERDGFIGCMHPKCREADIKLHSLDHFRNHVARVHGVALRPTRR
ncbi:FluG domain-containing protein [Hirsutella rhossiliensis]|uniref:FluG domain-containing protein n=1 Tax=Hirsutella rhossiliensis TaxID=111463 RepID=A0A9P8N8H6_9HYPO|nr:FluG domain-containing protein [Hirsutella rhossiliensis]KAH0968679.1 FluG domain-containing protein [Hirsutella rhossiliensis]